VFPLTGSYTGADAETVEQTVAIPIEEQVKWYAGDGAHKGRTNSGVVLVWRVTFNIGTNVRDRCP